MSNLMSMSVQNPLFQSAAKDAAWKAVQKEEGDNELFNAKAPSTVDPAALDVNEEELAQLRKYSRYMRFGMIGIATLLMITAFYNIGSTTTVANIFLAMYLFFFAILMCCFELGLKSVSSRVAQNFGFLYSAPGKVLFLIFVAIISFQLSTFGKVCFGLLLGYGICHLYLIYKHPKYPDYLRRLHYYNAVKAGKRSAPETV